MLVKKTCRMDENLLSKVNEGFSFRALSTRRRRQCKVKFSAFFVFFLHFLVITSSFFLYFFCNSFCRVFSCKRHELTSFCEHELC